MNMKKSYAHGRTISVDYSRHLFNSSRTAVTKRPSKSYSDTDAIEFIRRTALRGNSDFHERDPKIVGQANVERVCRHQVFNKDHSFLNKYGNKNLKIETHGLPAAENGGGKIRSNQRTKSVLHSGMDHDVETRSFCDSVSSNVSSNFANPGVERQKKRRDGNKDKIAKFDTITTWLENLPRPVL